MSRAFRLGIFIVFALLIFAAGVFWIGKNQMMFGSKYRLSANFKNVAGLATGAEVRVAGIQKGTVRRIDLPRSPDQPVRVEMELDSDTRGIVREDSTASIRAEGLMGDEYLEISPGSDQSPPVKNDDTLQGAQPVEISDLIGKADGLLDSANGALRGVTQTADNLGSITSKINKGSGTIGALVNDKQVYQNVTEATSELQEDLEAAKHNFLLSHFFHKRGYEDADDLTKHGIAQLPAEPPVRRFFWDGTKIFDKKDTAKLKDAHVLKEAGDYLQANPFGLAVVAGFSGMKGDSEDDKVLTEARAMVVRNYLVKNFRMDDTRLKTIGHRQIAGHRRLGVELLIYPPASASADENPGLASRA